MNFERILVQFGDHPVTVLEVVAGGAAVGLCLLLLASIMSWRAHSLVRQASALELRLAEMAGSIRQFVDQSQGAQAHLTNTLDQRLDQVGHRLGLSITDQAERTSLSLKHLYERLAVIDSAQKNLAALSGEMVSLKDILANKQARGAYGQGRMEAIIRDGLHSKAYSFQSSLSNGMRPDCLVKLPDSELRLVVDAKFPLEAFNALKLAKADADRRAAESRLRGDVLKHVKDIAEKYLIPGETHESAIMFVPSESVYADLYEHFEDVIQKAHRARVIIASPNILMLLVQTMQAIFKDAAMREQAGLIQIEVARLLEDVARLKERVGDLQKHFGAAGSDLEKLAVSADKIVKRGIRIESVDLTEAPVLVADQAKPRLVGI